MRYKNNLKKWNVNMKDETFCAIPQYMRYDIPSQSSKINIF